MMKQRGKTMPNKLAKRVFKNHGVMWQQLPTKHTQQYEREAEKLRDSRQADLRSDIDAAVARLHLMRLRSSQFCSEDVGPFRLSSCKFSEQACNEFDILYMDKRFEHEGLVTLRVVSSEPPEAPTTVERQILTSYDDGAKDSGSQIRPWWLAKLCRNRRLMRGCILQLKQESGEELFLLLILAIQTPFARVLQEVGGQHAYSSRAVVQHDSDSRGFDEFVGARLQLPGLPVCFLRRASLRRQSGIARGVGCDVLGRRHCRLRWCLGRSQHFLGGFAGRC